MPPRKVHLEQRAYRGHDKTDTLNFEIHLVFWDQSPLGIGHHFQMKKQQLFAGMKPDKSISKDNIFSQ